MPEQDPFQKLFEQLRGDLQDSATPSFRLDVLTKQRLKALYQVSQHLNRILDPDKLYQEVLRQIRALLKAEHIIILLREENGLRLRVGHNVDDQSRQNALLFSHSIVSQVMDKLKPLYSTNALSDPQFSQLQTIQRLEILSFICVPVIVGDQVIGTIYVDNRHMTNVFGEGDVEFLQAFANLLGIAIRNSLAYREIEELNRSLEQRVEERTRELQETIGKLEKTREKLIQTEKMASIGRLIAGFMHEFNNPMNFIHSNLPHLENYTRAFIRLTNELLAELPPPRREEYQRKFDLPFIREDIQKVISGIREGAKRSRQIVEDLRHISQGKTGQPDLIDWNENLRMLIAIFEERYDYPMTVSLSAADSFLVEGSRMELNQAVLNLLRNAGDAGATHVDINNRREGDSLICEIRDNGPGIPKEVQGDIFDPFFTTKEVGQGMGLGLSLVYNTIMHHNGKIEVDSAEGEGTTFRLTLPLTAGT